MCWKEREEEQDEKTVFDSWCRRGGKRLVRSVNAVKRRVGRQSSLGGVADGSE